MASPAGEWLDGDQAVLTARVLSEVASYLSSGAAVDEILGSIAETLRTELELNDCRVWTRTSDGASLRPVFRIWRPGMPPDAIPDGAPEISIAEARRTGPPQGWQRFPLEHEGEFLGVIDAGPSATLGDESVAGVIRLACRFLSPLLGSMELSEDLAGEVALRTMEIESQRRFISKIIDSLPHGLYVVDRKYRIQAWNQKREAGTQGIAREQAIGRTVFEVLKRQSAELLKEEFDTVFQTGAIQQMQVLADADGEERYFRISKIPMRLNDDEVTHVITIGEDITDWKQVQDQVTQTDKLAAVGQLAAGVMHEINNPLATIGACIEAITLRVDDLAPGPRAGFEEYIRIIESELSRCKSIVDGLLDFSRPKARRKRPVDVNQVVEDALFLARHHEKFRRINLKLDRDPDLPPVMANAEQLIQAFLAIMINAIDAMDGVGKLHVDTCMNPGRAEEVLVSFTDSGPGIPREEIGKIFEPFYTTKEPGRGTGLGLSICYGIIQEHLGRITIDSQEGRGATFQVMLPTARRGQ